jgi:4-diphosphocytidyl-2-C-methyl-D-erythritol kinase
MKLARNEEIEDSLLFNVFEEAAFTEFQGLDKYRNDFLAAGADSVHLAGSGPALFTMVKDRFRADAICTRLKEHGYQSCCVKTLAGIDYLKTSMEG